MELSILPEREVEADTTAPARQKGPWLKRNRSRSATPLWLIREVTVTSDIGGATHREIHVYSNYRLFRAHTKILLSP